MKACIESLSVACCTKIKNFFLFFKALDCTGPGKKRTAAQWVLTVFVGYWLSFPPDKVSPVGLSFQGKLAASLHLWPFLYNECQDSSSC